MHMSLCICSVPQVDVSADVTNCLVYLENYIYYAGLSRKVSRKCLEDVSFVLFSFCSTRNPLCK